MSFKAQIDVAGAKNNILDLSYALKQETDATGRPSSITRGGQITLTVESTGDTKFFEWMCNNFERKDGKITFTKRDSDATMKELSFKEGYLVSYRENFNATGENPITETFTISAKEISMGNASHMNQWAV
ncbi:type VI secretion system tube protein TssD [Niabella yanshanensis]|uniref:Type VI secretion system tube protein TssD n=1 Tax=Niabella yanshanensis TaxID=577386 RepID=A0ABZ0WCP7_9BACT|nr:type VI secretion system tube protein TssD [Niabella yanshanensis]WQD40060.1 type VI secretion system tube protein TssD [Niabella yanshanensis]